MSVVFYFIAGLLAGTFSGFFGIGGGVIMVPVLVFLFGLTQHQAQGTALAAMLPPITLLATLRYYYGGNVNIPIAIFMSIGLLLGAYFGAEFSHYVPENILKRLFGVLLLFVSVRMIFFK